MLGFLIALLCYYHHYPPPWHPTGHAPYPPPSFPSIPSYATLKPASSFQEVGVASEDCELGLTLNGRKCSNRKL